MNRSTSGLFEVPVLTPSYTDGDDRRKISPEGRAQWEQWQREKADVERRLALVDIQTKMIEHLTSATACKP